MHYEHASLANSMIDCLPFAGTFLPDKSCNSEIKRRQSDKKHQTG